ncbi:MAG: isoprenylcysteine carboxylmethyltransferase family protein, partial [Candidatus Competibacteraceae bacterium]|nr:isoprenylcysteine carboxylmethyltransferase family protein [Candidatus Competibacteraceae bacterium]
MRRIGVFSYGVVCYGIFFATFLYAIGFIGNLWVPKTLDGPPQLPLLQALLIDLGLLSLFAVQHSVMARPGFKRLWTQIVPRPMERSTYVLFSSLALLALFAFWQPLGGTLWQVDSPLGRTLIYGLYFLGWALVLAATFLINHFDLFGLRQVWLYLRGRRYTHLPFTTPGLYK